MVLPHGGVLCVCEVRVLPRNAKTNDKRQTRGSFFPSFSPSRGPAVGASDHVVGHVLGPLPAPFQGVRHVGAVAALGRQDELIVAQKSAGPATPM